MEVKPFEVFKAVERTSFQRSAVRNGIKGANYGLLRKKSGIKGKLYGKTGGWPRQKNSNFNYSETLAYLKTAHFEP